MDAGISLSEALQEPRRELYAAQDAGAGRQLRFEVEQAQLTPDVEVRRVPHHRGSPTPAFGTAGLRRAAAVSGRSRRRTAPIRRTGADGA
ncbi:trypco2 family protein [Streptomyces sp. NPDC057245]|uniref:trypco2 family protein n=1 Tax=Streptomyces sp. NPDC057245 TaxID=3346065 RepID=UPI00362686E3